MKNKIEKVALSIVYTISFGLHTVSDITTTLVARGISRILILSCALQGHPNCKIHDIIVGNNPGHLNTSIDAAYYFTQKQIPTIAGQCGGYVEIHVALCSICI